MRHVFHKTQAYRGPKKKLVPVMIMDTAAMTYVDAKPLNAAEIRQIEQRAHELRAQAVTKVLTQIVHALFSATRKAASCPSCARPLRG